MLDDAILGPALVMTAGTLAVMALRPLRTPAVTAALLAGGILGGMTGGGAAPSGEAIRSLAAAFLGLVVGAQLDPGRLRRLGRSVAARTLTQGVLVLLLVGAALWIAGADLSLVLVVGAASVASSPIALGAVAAETRSEGDFTQRLLALSTLSLPLALLPPLLGLARYSDLARLAWLLPAGVACGVVLLFPVSRSTSRGSLLAASGGGVVLLLALDLWLAPRPAAGIPRLHPQALLVPISILAGFVATNFIHDRDRARDALRTLSLPAVIAFFAAEGMGGMGHGGVLVAGDLGIALLVVAARAVALLVAALLAGDAAASPRSALAQLPMAGIVAAVPVLDGLGVSGDPAPQHIERLLLLAGLLSTAVGAVAARWALAASGEAVAESEAPDDWRMRMRQR